MAREYYNLQLKEVKKQMTFLGTMILEVIQETLRAFYGQDVQAAQKIVSGDDRIDAQVRQIEQLCYTLLLRQQPVAGDLRAVSAVMKMLTDMERIGDHGADISELTILMSTEKYPSEITLIERMSKETTVMLIEAAEAFAEGSAKKAEAVIARDDAVDALFLAVKNSLAKSIRETETNAMRELDLLMVAKYLERIGDHATNIAEWVKFSITGEFPKD